MNDFLNQFSTYEIKNFGLVRLPSVNINKDQKELVGLLENNSNFEFLSALARKGFEAKKHKLSINKHNEYLDRLKYELEIFEELGFTDYVLLVWMVVNKARELGVFIDYGRGSCVASFTFALLDVTGVLDVIDKGLLFERFVSRVRSKKQLIDDDTWLLGNLIADADLNLGDGRDKIIKWLEEIYPNKICKILNLSTFTGKILIKDVYKSYLEVEEDEAKRISDMIDKQFGIVEDITDTYKNNDEFKNWVDNNKYHKEIFEIAQNLSSLIRQTSTHASGYVISYFDLNDYVPMELDKDGNKITGFDMREVSNFAVKLDLLSLTTNKIINDILHQIPEKIENLNLDDNPEVYTHLQDKNLLPYGLYQISADCAYRVTAQIKPKNIQELSDINALARPGALAYVEGYVKNTQECPHPLFQDILKSTRNFALYQEQLMQMAVAIGFTLDQSESLRKIVGKKLVHEVKEWKQKIYDKVKENNLPGNIGDLFWKLLDESSKYSFNLSHSLATSYLTALTVYLKYKYPLQFYTACLNSVRDLASPFDEIALISKELVNFNIKLLPPNIKNSEDGFYIEGKDIRFGLKMIKGVSEKSIDKLKSFCTKNAQNKFEVFESLKSCGVNIGLGSSLVQAGCLDGINKQSRSRMVLELQTWNILTDKEKILCTQVANKNNYDVLNCILFLKDNKDENGKNYIKESRFETIKKKYQKYKEIYQLNNRNEKLANYYYEKTILGYSYSSTLKEIFDEFTEDLIGLKEIKDEVAGIKIKGVGFVVDKPYKGKSKKGNKYMSLKISDESGMINAKIFTDKLENCEIMNGRALQESDLIIFEGTTMDGCVFLDKAGLQSARVFMKLSQLSKED